MGIKDNFSQAVKELWKKDGQGDSNSQQKNDQPNEIEQYLRQGDTAAATPVPPGVEVNSSGVPLETPYYPTNPPTNTRNTAETQNVQGGQNIQASQPSADNVQTGMQAQPAPEQSGVNQNVRSVQEMRAEPTGEQGMPSVGAQEPPLQNGFDQYNNQPYNQNIQNIQQNFGQNNSNVNPGAYNQGGYNPQPPAGGGYGGGYNNNGGFVPPASGGGIAAQMANETEEITVISKNTVIDGNVRSLANMEIDGNIKGNVETTRNVNMSGKIVGDITCNNAAMNSAAMQGNVSLKGRMKMDRDTILIGNLAAQYADVNGRIRGALDIVGKAELKRDAIVFGDINASTIAVIDGAIIQGYVNTTFLSKEDSRNVFPEAISLDNKDGKGNPAPNSSNS